MATVKFTAQRGKNDLWEIAQAAGTAEAQSDTVSINIDFTKMTKGDVLTLIDDIKAKIHAGKWPA